MVISYEVIITTRKQSLGQGNIFAPVCHSVHRGGEIPDPPGSRHPPWEQNPPVTRYTPGEQTPPLDQVHPLGPGTPPWDQVHPPGADTHPPGPGTPPRSRHPPGTGNPPGADTPWTRYPPPPSEQTPPQVQSMLGNTVNTRAVRILLECNFVATFFRTSSATAPIAEFFSKKLGLLT